MFWAGIMAIFLQGYFLMLRWSPCGSARGHNKEYYTLFIVSLSPILQIFSHSIFALLALVTLLNGLGFFYGMVIDPPIPKSNQIPQCCFLIPFA